MSPTKDDHPLNRVTDPVATPGQVWRFVKSNWIMLVVLAQFLYLFWTSSGNRVVTTTQTVTEAQAERANLSKKIDSTMHLIAKVQTDLGHVTTLVNALARESCLNMTPDMQYNGPLPCPALFPGGAVPDRPRPRSMRQVVPGNQGAGTEPAPAVPLTFTPGPWLRKSEPLAGGL